MYFIITWHPGLTELPAHWRPADPYPFSIDECFDLYRVLVETTGMVIGMSGHSLNVVLTGDSAYVSTFCVLLPMRSCADHSQAAPISPVA